MVPYEGYVEVNLQIPEVGVYNQGVLMLLVHDSSSDTVRNSGHRYSITELSNASNWWRKPHLSSVRQVNVKAD